MSAQFMRRNIRISVRLTEEEHRLLKEKMARIGVTNQEAFLRKMALDGYILRLDLPELKEMLSQLRYMGNNVNQIAKRANEVGVIDGVQLAIGHRHRRRARHAVALESLEGELRARRMIEQGLHRSLGRG